MLTQKCIFEGIHPQNWFAPIDLKDMYFHVSILPRYKPFLYFSLLLGLALQPRLFWKVAVAATVPLKERGIRILNYFNYRLILAHSQDQLCEYRDMLLRHFSQLGLQVKWDKN